MLGIEDVKRLITELSERNNQETSLDWAQRRDLDPEMVVFMVEKIVEYSHFLCVEIAMKSIADEEAEFVSRTDDEDNVMVGVAISMDDLMGSAVFNGFALGWEVFRQFAPPTVMPPI